MSAILEIQKAYSALKHVMFLTLTALVHHAEESLEIQIDFTAM